MARAASPSTSPARSGSPDLPQRSLALQVVQPAQIAYGPLGTGDLAGWLPSLVGDRNLRHDRTGDRDADGGVGAYSGIAIPFTAATGTATFNFAACAGPAISPPRSTR